MDAATLAIFSHLFASVAEEMGVTLGRTAYSPNIKERLDFSCAVFLGDGDRPRLLAQAAHIPVHLGAMPASVQAAVARCAPFRPGDVVILNDPYLGGNHLPDITLVSPIFVSPAEEQRRLGAGEKGSKGEEAVARVAPSFSPAALLPSTPAPPPPGSPAFFVASRAHHADVGGMSPGSMPLSTELFQEGIIIPPIKLVDAGARNQAVWDLILRNVRTPWEREGDLAAQLAAHTVGARRLEEIARRYGLVEVWAQAEALIDYAAALTRAAISRIPDGRYAFTDYLDDDGQGSGFLPVAAAITVEGERLTVDFEGTAPAVAGNLNAVPAIVESAVVYCLRCVALALLAVDLPMNQGIFTPLSVRVPPGSLLDPRPPHAVAAGNVETSQRVVDAVFGALALALPELAPAASQGTMNNLTFGGIFGSRSERERRSRGERVQGSGGEKEAPRDDDGPQPPGSPAPLLPSPLAPQHAPAAFAYYETIGGGAGAGAGGDGASGVHVHMSNTRNTPVEALEHSYPLRVVEYSLRRGSGGRGLHAGGEGIVRALQFLASVEVTITSERRRRGPYGAAGGEAGAPGRNTLVRGGKETELPGKASARLEAGDILRLETPGGGGWGQPGNS